MKKTVRTIVVAIVATIVMIQVPIVVLAMEDNGVVGAEEAVSGEGVSGKTDEYGEEDIRAGEDEEQKASSDMNYDEESDSDIGTTLETQSSDQNMISEEGVPNEGIVPEKRQQVENQEKTISAGASESQPVTVAVPIYNYDIVNVVVPASYAVALNPYEFPIQMGDGSVSAAQVLSHNYGIVNKSSRDKIVRVSLTVEDQNEGQITFVNTPEEALDAGPDTYAIYLAVVPAAADGIGVSNLETDEGLLSEALENVSMVKAENAATALKAGENMISFKLSKAIYDFPEGRNIALGEAAAQDVTELFELKGLAADGRGVTAFTFDGVLNPRANWAKLLGGLKISVVYTYENAVGNESIVEGTGAMLAP